jgi:hypothetical protein
LDGDKNWLWQSKVGDRNWFGDWKLMTERWQPIMATDYDDQKLATKNFQLAILWWPNLFLLAIHNKGSLGVIKILYALVLMDMTNMSKQTLMWRLTQNGCIMSILTALIWIWNIFNKLKRPLNWEMNSSLILHIKHWGFFKCPHQC